MSSVIVPKLCDLSGCWQVATVTGRDCKGHKVNGCTQNHVRTIQANRAKVYGLGDVMREFYRQNWQKYAHVSKF